MCWRKLGTGSLRTLSAIFRYQTCEGRRPRAHSHSAVVFVLGNFQTGVRAKKKLRLQVHEHPVVSLRQSPFGSCHLGEGISICDLNLTHVHVHVHVCAFLTALAESLRLVPRRRFRSGSVAVSTTCCEICCLAIGGFRDCVSNALESTI